MGLKILFGILRKLIHLLLFWSDKKIKGLDLFEIIDIPDKEKPRSEKEAILILPGLGDSPKGRNAQKSYFTNQGYDLFIPIYQDSSSFELTVNRFNEFYFREQLNEYKKVHVFSYILGSWVINRFIEDNGYLNIATIVYDRSPLQERAPKLAYDISPLIPKIIGGNMVVEFRNIPYRPIQKKDLKIGVLIESKATKMVRIFKKKVMNYGPIHWRNLDFSQEYDDAIFTRLDHDEFYYSFETIGPDIMTFIKTGKFTEDARREWFGWDPMIKYKKS
jgi:hypothetical protein